MDVASASGSGILNLESRGKYPFSLFKIPRWIVYCLYGKLQTLLVSLKQEVQAVRAIFILEFNKGMEGKLLLQYKGLQKIMIKRK